MKNFGFIPTEITDDIVRFKPHKSLPIPKKYSYKLFLSPVCDQGVNPFCIPYSIATWINWKENIKVGTKFDFHIRYADIYNSKKSKGEGMTYQEAFNYLKTHGVRTDKGIKKISEAALVPGEAALKAAILANGPCFGALPVYNSNSDTFWVKTKVSPEGWHSVTIVGWNEEGYIIRNSWGTSFADNGYVIMPYADAIYFKEIWTILG